MLEAISGKVFATIVTLSVFLFSSYTGNDPSLKGFNSRVGENYLQLRTSLYSAFENDFPDVFRSGSTIPVNFKLTIKGKHQNLYQHTFVNSVNYDPAKGVFNLSLGGMNRKLQTDSYEKMLAEISVFECSIPYQPAWGDVTINLEASLPTVRFQQLQKNVDLMVLWKYKKPRTSTSLNLRKMS